MEINWKPIRPEDRTRMNKIITRRMNGVHYWDNTQQLDYTRNLGAAILAVRIGMNYTFEIHCTNDNRCVIVGGYRLDVPTFCKMVDIDQMYAEYVCRALLLRMGELIAA